MQACQAQSGLQAGHQRSRSTFRVQIRLRERRALVCHDRLLADDGQVTLGDALSHRLLGKVPVPAFGVANCCANISANPYCSTRGCQRRERMDAVISVGG